MNAQTTRVTIIALIIITTILVSRLLLLLFAARPDNVGVAFLLEVSAPWAWPMSWIDAQQPVYGARFERGTLLTIMLCLVGLYFVRRHTS
ncbi:MAG: hypothetical protein ACO3F2_09540 [Roseiflexaceae bacterium]